MTAAPHRDGFVAGRHPIDAYGAGGFKFAGMGHVGSILATPSGIHAVDARTLADVRFETFAPVIEELKQSPRSIEFLVVGAGERMAILPALLARALRGAGLRFETMATGPAARMYNVMIGENRRVAALLLAVP